MKKKQKESLTSFLLEIDLAVFGFSFIFLTICDLIDKPILEKVAAYMGIESADRAIVYFSIGIMLFAVVCHFLIWLVCKIKHKKQKNDSQIS